jgi:L-fuculose-phosphate aldolase
MMTELDLRKAICEVGRRLYARNLVAATDGNISVRLGPDRYLCTPSGVSKGFMAPRDLLVADRKGGKVQGEGRVTTEFFTHLAAYEERPDVSAVVHAHPPKAIGFTLAGVSLADCVLPEVVYSIGGVPTTAYATPATREGSEVIREHIRGCDALLMDRHGALTVGVNVYDALNKMEKIEHAAETLLTARLLGRVRPLEAGEVEKLYGVREDYGVSGKVYRCAVCEECPKGVCPVEDNSRLDRVVSETLHVLGGA